MPIVTERKRTRFPRWLAWGLVVLPTTALLWLATLPVTGGGLEIRGLSLRAVAETEWDADPPQGLTLSPEYGVHCLRIGNWFWTVTISERNQPRFPGSSGPDRAVTGTGP